MQKWAVSNYLIVQRFTLYGDAVENESVFEASCDCRMLFLSKRLEKEYRNTDIDEPKGTASFSPSHAEFDIFIRC